MSASGFKIYLSHEQVCELQVLLTDAIQIEGGNPVLAAILSKIDTQRRVVTFRRQGAYTDACSLITGSEAVTPTAAT